MSKYEIDNGGGSKRSLWVLGAILAACIVGLVYLLSNFG